MSINQVKELAEIASSFGSQLDLSDLVESLSLSAAAGSARTVASAVTTLVEAGLDPREYIGQSRSAMRAKQQSVRLEIEMAKAQQALEHQAALNAVELRKANAEASIAESSAKRMNAPRPAQQPAQRPVPAPPVPAPPATVTP